MPKKNILLLVFFLLLLAMAAYRFIGERQAGEPEAQQPPQIPVQTPAQTPEQTPPVQPVSYTNDDYGFTFDLPEEWRGFSVIEDKWQGAESGEKGETVVAEGPQYSLRHPQWREQQPRQDIPIMIFTLREWDDLGQEKFHIGAAPVGPQELGRNNMYVFALPARYNFAFLPGYEEVEKILEGKPLHSFDIPVR